MFGLFKKKITDDEAIDYLLYFVFLNRDALVQRFVSQFGYSGDVERLEYEMSIFCLWLVTNSIPKAGKEFKDALHKKICEALGFDLSMSKDYMENIIIRYQKYNKAFSSWQSNPQGVIMCNTIYSILEKSDLGNNIYMMDISQALSYTNFFTEAFQLFLQQVGVLRKEFKSPTLNI